MNGIPWWYFYREPGLLDGHHLESVDPGAAQWNAIGPERAIGCVVDPAPRSSAKYDTVAGGARLAEPPWA
jgi:hypothetical protein